MASSRSALDKEVHERGGQVLMQAGWHPGRRRIPPILTEFKDWRDGYGEEMRRASINLARDALDYKRLREEQEVEGLTNKFARMSLDDNIMNLRRRVVG